MGFYAIAFVIFSIAATIVGIEIRNSTPPDQPQLEYRYKFTPENNKNWTCFALKNSGGNIVYCVEDAPGYEK